MSVNKKSVAKKANLKASTGLTKARLASRAPVRVAAFKSATSRYAMLASVRAACGPRPVMALSEAVRLEVVVGLMSGYLARKGSNLSQDALFGECREAITKRQGFGGKQKLRKGMLGRRTKLQEDAYASARVQWSTIAKDAGVTLPAKSGSNSSGRKPQPAKNATAKQAANDSKPVVRTYKSKDELVKYAGIQAAAMLATINRSAKIAPIELKSAVQDFQAAVKKLGA
jgi:hypothetical protein